MDSGVFILQSDNVLVRMNETPYEAESLLQALLEDHPALLAGDQIDATSPRRWLVIKREAGIPDNESSGDRWSVDHLLLDQDAVPTFVEVKRASDTRARREVVAQMLDYAANASEYWPIDRMREFHASRCAAHGLDPAEEISNLLEPDSDIEEFWTRAATNLRDGRIRLLFVADKIPPALQRIVEFLNRQMNPAEVLAVEIRQFTSATGANLRTLVPRVLGQTEQIRQSKTAPQPRPARETTDRQGFVEEAPAAFRATIEGVLDVAEAAGLTATAFTRAGNSAWGVLSLPGVSGSPSSLDYGFLWISLGRHHPALRNEPTNRALRDAILRIFPASSAKDPKKTEVGIRLDSIRPEHIAGLRDVFAILAQGLAAGT